MEKTRNTRARVLARAIGRLMVAEKLLSELTYHNCSGDLERMIKYLNDEMRETPVGAPPPQDKAA